MPSWNNVLVDIKAFTDNAAKRIEKIDFSQDERFGFGGMIKRKDKNFICEEHYTKNFEEFNDDEENEAYGPFCMMRAIAYALGSDGEATMTLEYEPEWDDEINVKCEYKYDGKRITLKTTREEGNGYFFIDFLSALLDMSTSQLQELYNEMDIEEDDFYEEDEIDKMLKEGHNHLAYLIAANLGHPDLLNSKDTIKRYYKGPLVSALFDTIDKSKA